MVPIISVKNLRKAYGKTVAVEDVSFDVEESEIFGLVGANGAGKTTIIECLQGLKKPDSGIVQILGLDPVKNTRALWRRNGCRLHSSVLPAVFGGRLELNMISPVSSQSQSWRPLFEQWGNESKRKSEYSGVSAGQRFSLALALVKKPRVLILDEVTLGLDPAARRVAWDMVRAIRKNGTAVVMVPHSMDEAEYLCDRLAVLNHGKVIAAGSPRRLIDQYGGENRIIFTPEKPDLPWLKDVLGINNVTRNGKSLEVEGSGTILARVVVALAAHGIVPADLHTKQSTLEDVFLKLTGYNAAG